MGMTIDEAIQHIKNSCYIVGYPTHDKQQETRENVNASLDLAISTMRKYQKIEQIVREWNDMNSFDSMVQIRGVVDGNDNTVKAKLLYALSKESTMVLSTAYAYAKNYVMCGEDITKAWITAVQHASIIEKVREKVWVEAYDSFKKEYENRLKVDKMAMLTELKMKIEDTGAYEQETQGKTEFLKGLDYSLNLIQQKIDSLKGEENDI